MMDSRAQFEEWFKPKKIAMQNRGISTVRIVRLCQRQWEAWQASRAAIEVVLPGKVSKLNTTDSGFVSQEAENYDEALDDCAEAIRACGISIKGKSS